MKHIVVYEIVNIVWLLFLMGLFVYLWQQRQVTQKAKQWQKVPGHITHCEWNVDGPVMWPKIEYVYEVNDHEYTGEYLCLDMIHNQPYSAYCRHLAYKVAMAFQNNDAIDVYYNPDNPSESVLDRTIPRKLHWILGFVFFLAMIHVVILFMRHMPI